MISNEKVIQNLISYNEIIPSIDFSSYVYELYLDYATPSELERDIIFENTYVSISTQLIYEELK